MQEFVITANLKKYDIVSHFSTQRIAFWKQPHKCLPNDIVYIYVGAPYSRLMYKCLVINTDCVAEKTGNSSYIFSSNSRRKSGRIMKLMLLEELPTAGLSHNELRKHGLSTVQCATAMNDELREYLERYVDISDHRSF